MDQIKTKFHKWKKNKNEILRNNLFQEIWEVYHPKLQVYVANFQNNYSDHTDLVSDILLHILESISKYNEEFSFSTWIYTIARNYQIDLLRKKKIRVENIDDHLVSNENTPEFLLVKRTEEELIRNSISLLSSTDKELIYLHFYEELKYREISHITGIPEGTIKYRMWENKKFLKKNLEGSLIK